MDLLSLKNHDQNKSQKDDKNAIESCHMWNENDANDEFYVLFSFAVKIYKNKPELIEKCRLIEREISLKEAFSSAVIETSNAYAKFLLAKYGSLCFENKAFLLIARHNNYEIMEAVCKWLLDNGQIGKINNIYEIFDGEKFVEQSALHEALYNGSVECLKVLLKYGADTSVRNSLGLAPWEYFCDEFDSVQYLYTEHLIAFVILVNCTEINRDKTYFKEKVEEIIKKMKVNLNKYDFINHDKRTLESLGVWMDKDEYFSLKHLARICLRKFRIQSNLLAIHSSEEMFYFY